jgi:hypothetical protein
LAYGFFKAKKCNGEYGLRFAFYEMRLATKLPNKRFACGALTKMLFHITLRFAVTFLLRFCVIHNEHRECKSATKMASATLLCYNTQLNAFAF